MQKKRTLLWIVLIVQCWDTEFQFPYLLFLFNQERNLHTKICLGFYCGKPLYWVICFNVKLWFEILAFKCYFKLSSAIPPVSELYTAFTLSNITMLDNFKGCSFSGTQPFFNCI